MTDFTPTERRPDTDAAASADVLLTAAQTGVPLPGMPALPGFCIEREVARGGMGVVYLAHDLTLNRTVAVKMIQERYRSDPSAAQRFLAEAQITAQLQHPGIPPIYQVGTLADGRPFLAMKLIRGQTLDQLLRSPAMPQNKLAIFEAIAQAVGYAHAHQVIHRDLKPANVMVGAFGEVQVMDWGLAKLLGPHDGSWPGATDPMVSHEPTQIRTPRSETEHQTEAGSILGTPAFMPPEQAAGELDKVGPRSDVFGLGAVLCSMLTGEPPYAGRDGWAVRVAAMRCQTEAAFARLAASGAEPSVVALCKSCLALDPNDRPADGNAVAAAVARLRAEAEERARAAELAQTRAEVQAAEQRKRRQALLASASLLTGVLLGGLGGSVWQMSRAILAEREAVAEKERAQQNEQRANQAADQERQAREVTESVLDFVDKRVFALARPKEQDGGLGYDVKMAEAIKASLPHLAESFKEQPLVEARLRLTLGRSFWYLGEPRITLEMSERARALYAEQHGPAHPDTLMAMNAVAGAHAALGQHDLALPLFEETLRLRQTALGPDHPDTILTLRNLATVKHNIGRHAEVLPLREELFRSHRARLGPDHPTTLRSMQELAVSYEAVGRLAEALELRVEGRQRTEALHGPDHPATLGTMKDLAVSYFTNGRQAEAQALFEESLARHRTTFGPTHLATLQSMNNLAMCHGARGRHDLAVALLEEVLVERRRQLDPDHPETLVTMNNLALSYVVIGRAADALVLMEEALPLCKSKLGPNHPNTLMGMNTLSEVLAVLGRQAEALDLRQETLERRRAKLGPDHPTTLQSMHNLAVSYAALGRHADALPLRQETLERQRYRLGDDHPDTLSGMHNLASTHEALGQWDKAIERHEQTLKRRRAKLGADHPDTLDSMNSLAICYGNVGRPADAAPLFAEAYQRRRALLGPTHADTLGALLNFAHVQRQVGQPGEALPLLVEAAAMVEEHRFTPPHSGRLLTETAQCLEALGRWTEAESYWRKWLGIAEQRTATDAEAAPNAALGLARNLIQQQRQADAESLLLKMHGQLKDRSPPNARMLGMMCDGLIELYTAWEKPDQVQKWQAEKAGLGQ